jgi:hypothetical protein
MLDNLDKNIKNSVHRLPHFLDNQLTDGSDMQQCGEQLKVTSTAIQLDGFKQLRMINIRMESVSLTAFPG